MSKHSAYAPMPRFPVLIWHLRQHKGTSQVHLRTPINPRPYFTSTTPTEPGDRLHPSRRSVTPFDEGGDPHIPENNWGWGNSVTWPSSENSNDSLGSDASRLIDDDSDVQELAAPPRVAGRVVVPLAVNHLQPGSPSLSPPPPEKIPRPAGQNGHPETGGFSLRKAVAPHIDQHAYKSLQVCSSTSSSDTALTSGQKFTQKVGDALDPTRSFSDQKPGTLERLRSLVSARSTALP